MKNLKKINLLTVSVILVFLIINDFFYNIYYISKNSFKERMSYHYGYCYKNGYGFIDDIVNHYNIKNNINTYNTLITPSSNWFFYNSNSKHEKNKIIVLNYKKNSTENSILTIKINTDIDGKYKIIKNFENCYFLERKND